MALKTVWVLYLAVAGELTGEPVATFDTREACEASYAAWRLAARDIHGRPSCVRQPVEPEPGEPTWR